MKLSRRDFLKISAVSPFVISGVSFSRKKPTFEELLDFKPHGNLTLIFTSDIHGHLKPVYAPEPMNFIVPEEVRGKSSFLTGSDFMKRYNIRPGSVENYTMTCNNFINLATEYGRTGGAPQMATVIKTITQQRGKDKCLVLDAGDAWITSGIALKTDGMAIVEWMNYIGYDYFVAHWDLTVGKEKFLEIINKHLKAKFLSYNITDDAFGDLIFPPYDVKEVGGVKVGVIGSSFPFTPLANPRKYIEGWRFGIRPGELQGYVNELREKHRVDVVVLLSHDGLPLDAALVKAVKGIDVAISGHTHDITPEPIKAGDTIVVSPGSHGKFVGRLDLEVGKGKVVGHRFKLIPVLSDVIPQDKEARDLVEKWYQPHEKEFSTVIGTTRTFLYKRDLLYSTWDRLICEAVADHLHGVDIVTSPGYRWGPAVLPNSPIRVEDVYNVLGITYPEVFVLKRKGKDLIDLWEDLADNVFNPNPFYQQGGDMPRIYGVEYELNTKAKQGNRLKNLKVKDKPMEQDKEYLVAVYGGPPPPGVKPEKLDIREIVINYIKKKREIVVDRKPNVKVLDHPYNTDCFWR